MPAARVEQAVGEDVTALAIARELDLVDREEVDRRWSTGIASTVQTQYAARGGTRFSSPVTSATRASPTRADDPVVDLAREQAQRQADHAASVLEHPLDRAVGLAGVGGPEDRGDAAVAEPTTEP